MKSIIRLIKTILTVGFCFFGVLSSGHAENWVRVMSDPEGDPSFIDVDVDSIRKGDDGLVYFRSQEDLGISPTAIDCQRQIYYVIGDGSRDWRSNGSPIHPGDEEAEFVCLQVSK